VVKRRRPGGAKAGCADCVNGPNQVPELHSSGWPHPAAPSSNIAHLPHAVGDGHVQALLRPALLSSCRQQVVNGDRLPHQDAQLLACSDKQFENK